MADGDNDMKCLSALIVLLAVSNQVQAMGDCDKFNDVSSLSYWESPALLLTCVLATEPTAAGPSEVGVGFSEIRGLSRGEAEELEPQIQEAEPVVEAESVAEPEIELHIKVPSTEDDEWVGYSSGVLRTRISDPKTNRKGVARKNSWNQISDEDVFSGNGGFVLSLNDGAIVEDRVTASITSEDGSVSVEYDRTGRVDNKNRATVSRLANARRNAKAVYRSNEFPIDDATGREQHTVILEVNEGEPASNTLLKDYWTGTISIAEDNRAYWTSREQLNADITLVAGVLTPLADINSLISGDVQATYVGAGLGFGQTVSAMVDFGEESFTAEVGGVDSATQTQYGLSSNMAFSAAGVLKDQHLISTDIKAVAGNGVTGGYLQGSLFGENASMLGGAYEVTAGEKTLGDTFSASKQ